MFSNPLLFTMVSDLQEGAGDQGAVGAEPSMENTEWKIGDIWSTVWQSEGKHKTRGVKVVPTWQAPSVKTKKEAPKADEKLPLLWIGSPQAAVWEKQIAFRR